MTAPHRHHAAFRGASILAGLPNFSQMCVWNEDWQEVGSGVLKKWSEDMATNNEYDNSSGSEDNESVGGGSLRRPGGHESGGEEEEERSGAPAPAEDFAEEDF
jgi:hypothetical protein